MRILVAVLVCVICAGQEAGRGLRRAPVEKVTVSAGFRDWYGIALAGNTVVSSSQNGSRGGLYGADAATGKVKWSYRPAAPAGPYVWGNPAIVGDVAVAAFGGRPGMVAAVGLGSGKEVWRAAIQSTPVRGVAGGGDAVFVCDAGGVVVALAAATGNERWRLDLGSGPETGCGSAPVADEGVVYVMGKAQKKDAAAGFYDFFVVAVDAREGRERGRYGFADGSSRMAVTREGVYVMGDRICALERGTLRERWKTGETVREVNGKKRYYKVESMVEAGGYVVAGSGEVIAGLERGSGRVAWMLEGKELTAGAAAGDVLYVQGKMEGDEEWVRGMLMGVEVGTRKVLWRYVRNAAGAEAWRFGDLTPAEGGIWATAYGAVVRLE